jgi:hypothetical protein
MHDSFKSSFFKVLGLLGLLGLGLTQVGCAYPVFEEPSVAVDSRDGHYPVHAQMGVPGQVIYAPPPRAIYVPSPRVIYAPPPPPRVIYAPPPPPRVIYAPPPPPRVVYAPRVYSPVNGWRHGNDFPPRAHERRHYRQGDGEPGRHDGRHDGRYDGRR